MDNNFNGFGMNLPNQNFGNNFNQNNNFNNGVNNTFSNSYGGEIKENPTPFTSLDGRKWATKDQEFRANQEFYRKNLNDSLNEKK